MTKPGDGPLPLYEKVKRHIVERIGSGEWPAEYRIPSEHELVRLFGVSRMTVHRALRELTASGFLSRVQGLGTFVATAKRYSALVEIRDIAQEIKDRSHHHQAKVVALEPIEATPALRARFDGLVGSVVFRSLVLHLENDQPVQIEERLVNPALAPTYLTQDFTRRTTFEFLQSQTPLTEVEQRLTAIAADQGIADLLTIPPGAPCLALDRRTWTGGITATVNRFVHPGDRYALASRYLVGPGNRPFP